jgi:predicted permease
MSSTYDALLPVVLLISAGYFAGHRGWLDPHGVRQLSALSFGLLCPALLFRTMTRVSVEWAELAAVAGYLCAEVLILGALLFALGRSATGVILAMSATFGNTVMIGIPLIGLAFGEAGLVYLFALVSAHSVLMLTLVTVALEWLTASRSARQTRIRSALAALGQAVIHPITLPILLGLAWGQTGWAIPALLDRPLEWLGLGFSPIALLMVGISLAHIVAERGLRPAAAVVAVSDPTSPAAPPGQLLRQAAGFTLLKNILHPVLAALICMMLGVRGLPVAVVVLAAALPIGATVLLFAQRYQVAREQVTTAIAVSTFSALLTLPIALTITRSLE